ncbi:MAG: PHP domain-containing protein [Candidatus Hydrogenedentes bacterium]|nr:PHP domain-containing protein [Candidatus Hydrogenedentota bacterium]
MHLHTNHSDGSDAPARVVERAAKIGLAAIAVTDHDTVSALPEASAAARACDIAFLTGTEISARYERVEVHVVGLGIQPEHPRLVESLHGLRRERATRAQQIVEQLHALGIPVDLDEIAASVPGGAIGRIHIARAIRKLGYAKTVQEAFDKYIGAGRKAYAAKVVVSCAEAIELIHEAGGLAFLAHPGIIGSRKIIPHLLTLPFDGLEAYHAKHSPGQVAGFLDLAKEKGLLIAGGSDCHGHAKDKPEMGKVRVPYEYYERIREVL